MSRTKISKWIKKVVQNFLKVVNTLQIEVSVLKLKRRTKKWNKNDQNKNDGCTKEQNKNKWNKSERDKNFCSVFFCSAFCSAHFWLAFSLA